MNAVECCDAHCTSFRICYLRLLRPGDSVPFKKPKYLLPLGAVEILLAFVVIIFGSLAIFGQSQGMTSAAPSLIGSPGIPVWLAVVLIVDGCVKISAFKRKTRFLTAIAFGFSSISTLSVVSLLAISAMAIEEEAIFYHRQNSVTGVVISSIISIISLALLVVTSLSALFCYLSLTSHDDRWFTDRGTQHDLAPLYNGQEGVAKLCVPSGQPAFLFYAPSPEAAKYSSVFGDVINKLETHDQKIGNGHENEYYEEITNGRKTADISEDGEPYITAAPSSANIAKTSGERY